MDSHEDQPAIKNQLLEVAVKIAGLTSTVENLALVIANLQKVRLDHQGSSDDQSRSQEGEPSERREIEVRKIELPKFTGEDPQGWLLKADVYFSFSGIEEDDKFQACAKFLDGAALWWFEWVRNLFGEISWREFQKWTVERFGNMDPSELTRLNQTVRETTVQEKETNKEDQLESVVASDQLEEMNKKEELDVSTPEVEAVAQRLRERSEKEGWERKEKSRNSRRRKGRRNRIVIDSVEKSKKIDPEKKGMKKELKRKRRLKRRTEMKGHKEKAERKMMKKKNRRQQIEKNPQPCIRDSGKRRKQFRIQRLKKEKKKQERKKKRWKSVRREKTYVPGKQIERNPNSKLSLIPKSFNSSDRSSDIAIPWQFLGRVRRRRSAVVSRSSSLCEWAVKTASDSTVSVDCVSRAKLVDGEFISFTGLQWLSKGLGYIQPTHLPLPAAEVVKFVLFANFSIVEMNMNLMWNSVGFYQIAKLGMISVSCFLEVVLGMVQYSRDTKRTILLVLVGVAVCIVTDLSVDFKGFMAAVVTVWSTALQQYYAHYLQRKYKLGSFNLLDTQHQYRQHPCW